MHFQNQKNGNLGVHKIEQNHALSEQKKTDKFFCENLGMHKNEKNYALPEQKKNWYKIFWNSGSA